MRRLGLILIVLALATTAVAQDPTLRIHYHRFDDAYPGWGLHLWGAVQEDGGTFWIDGNEYNWQNPMPYTDTDDYGVYWDVPISAPDAELGFIIHNGDIKDPGPDMHWDDYGTPPEIVEIWILSGFTQIFTEEPDPNIRLMSATSNGAQTITLQLATTADQLDAFHVFRDGAEETVSGRTTTTPQVVVLTMEDAIDITDLYTVQDDVGGNEIVVLHEFDDAAYEYDGGDLGAVYTPAATTFSLWSPVAAEVAVLIYDSPYPVADEPVEEYAMAPEGANPGVWRAAATGDHENRYYLYRMTVYGETYITPDLYSVALSSNSQRSMIVDLDATDPDGWGEDAYPEFPITDSIVYELHVRDVTAGEHWDGAAANKHKFLGVVEAGTSHEGLPTGFDHIVDMGVNTVQIMPMYDFSSVDENNPDSRNWGYDPFSYNTPEGSYSSDPDDGTTRIRELKAMVQAFHDAGIKVVMDVVYNHTHNIGSGGSLYDAMVPKYYYRLEDDGSYSNGSGCGNEVATEALMARQFIKQSCRYWVEEYHIDGFRFDLMGLMDTDILAEITAEIRAINPHAVIHGEPWGGYGSEILTGKGDQRGLGFGCFNDNIRNAIRGSTDGTDPGYAMNDQNDRAAVINGLEGAINDFTDGPSETVNYISAHDNYTWWDKLDHRWNPTLPPPGHDEDTLIRMNKFGISMVMTAQGVPFMHAGSEFLRTKRTGDPGQDEETIRNSYNADDEVNKLDWARRAEYDDVVEYYKGLIALRHARPEFRLTTKAAIQANQSFLSGLDGGAIAYTLADATPEDDWGRIMVVHNPSHESVAVPLPEGQWALVVDEDHAGTEVLASYVSPALDPLALPVAPRSTAVLYQQAAPAIQLNLFQNPSLDRYLDVAVNALDGSEAVTVTINDEELDLDEQATGTWTGRYVLSESGELVITVASETTVLSRTVSAWSLDNGAVISALGGRLELVVPAGARPGGWLLIADRTVRPDLPAGAFLLGAAGARLDREATLRIDADGGQVLQRRDGDAWHTLPATVDADGRLAVATVELGVFRLAAGSPVPAVTRLLGNAPNPFNPETTIRCELSTLDAAAPVNLRVYDVRGQLVRSLVSGRLPAGRVAVNWDGRDDAGRTVSSGVYIYRLETRQQALTGRMLMLK